MAVGFHGNPPKINSFNISTKLILKGINKYLRLELSKKEKLILINAKFKKAMKMIKGNKKYS